MKPNEDGYVKITLRLKPEEAKRLENAVGWGKRDPIFRRFINALCTKAEVEGRNFVESVAQGARGIEFN